MRKLGLAAAAALLLANAACSDSLKPEDIAGTYSATVFEFTNVNNTSQKVDVVDGGFSVSATIGSSGSFSITFDGQTETGTIAIDGSNVTITIDGDPATGTISRSGDTLTINLTTGIEFDFDDNGTDEPATLRIVMTRTS